MRRGWSKLRTRLACRGPYPRSPKHAAETLPSQGAAHAVRLGPGLELVVLGSGGPHGGGRASASYLVSAAGTPRLLIDVGSGSFVRLGQTRLKTDRIDTVLLTHLHVDHTCDLPGFIKSRDLLSQGPLTLRLFGPAGRAPYPGVAEFLERLFGASGAFAYLPQFRNPLTLTPHELPIDPDGPAQLLFAEDGLQVTSIAVDHGAAPALAYRVDYNGHSLVVSGDLTSRHTRITGLAHGADLLVYDAAVRDPPGSSPHLYELHTPPHKIGEIAAAAGVRQLVLSHISPATEGHEDEIRKSVRATFRGTLRFASDCMRVSTSF